MLPSGAIERRSPRLHNTAHHPATGTSRAWHAFAIIDLETVLKIADFTVRGDVIAECRAAGLDNDQCQLGRRYTALANQAGVLCGAYFCVMLVHFDVFVQKEV